MRISPAAVNADDANTTRRTVSIHDERHNHRTTPAASSAGTMSEGRLTIVVVALSILTFLGILSETSLNIAYSTLMGEFSISADVVRWLTTGYLLLLSVSISSSPFMVRKFATKTLFIMAIAIFTAGTVLGALALLPGAVLGAVSATVVGGMLNCHSVPDHCGSAAAGRVACHMAGGSPDQRPAHR